MLDDLNCFGYYILIRFRLRLSYIFLILYIFYNRCLNNALLQNFQGSSFFNLLDYSSGTSVERSVNIRQRGAHPEVVGDTMEGWTRWRLDYELWAVDTDA